MIRSFVRRTVPPGVLRQASRLYYLPLELGDLVQGRRDPLRPPRWLHFVGGGDFDTVGRRFLAHFQRVAALQPAERVLDVGCGVGRMALPLAGFLGPAGSYRGFDIVPEGIRWCQRHITLHYPRFQFQHADIFNAEYNPGGRERAASYRFPYSDGAFDFVFLTSVFTHMLPGDVANYLAEIRRVLRPGGRCLATCFLLNDESRRLMAGPHSLFNFHHDGGGYCTTTPDRPEAAVAYDEQRMRALVAQAGLLVREPPQYGAWCGRTGAAEGQDMLLLTSAAAPA